MHGDLSSTLPVVASADGATACRLAVFSLEASIAVNELIAALEFLQLFAKPKDGEAEYLSGSGP